MNRYLNRLWLAAGLTFPCIAPVWSAPTLPTIVISASRVEQNSIETPASITLITRRQIEQSGAHDLSQLLQARGGVQIDSLYGHADGTTIDMRGFGPSAISNTLILVDGRRLNNSGDSAAPDLGSIDLSRVERIEIVQGSAGTLYGNQAVGGMINIITRTPQEFTASVETELGSDRARSLHADLSQRLPNGLAYRINANRRIADNYRDNNRSARNDHNLRLDYGHDRGRLFIEQQYVDDNQALPGSLFADEMAADRQQSVAAYANDYEETRSDVTRIGLEQDLSLNWRFEGEATYRHNDHKFQTSFRAFPGSLSTQERRVKGLNPRLIGIFPLPQGEATLTTGADLERTDYDLVTSFGPQHLDQSVDAFYLQLTAPVSPAISSTVGWRRAKVDNLIDTGSGGERLDDRLSAGSLGMVFRPLEGLRLFVRVDENYRFATVDEHTNPVFGQPVGLDNQTGISHEAGVEWGRAGFSAKAVIYRLELKNEISFDSTTYYNTNLEKTRRDGLILEARWQTTPDLALGGSFTYTDPTITAGPFEGNRIPLVSARSARLNLDWTAARQWQLYSEVILRSRRIFGSDFANAFGTLPGYGLLNAGGHYTNGPWRLGLRIDNLLDKSYAGSGSIGLDASYTSREAYFPAPKRTFWLTARYQFE